MTYLEIEKIRSRTWHAISYDTARQGGDGLTQAQLQNFIAHAFMPTDIQLRRLANYYGIKVSA